MVHEELLLQVAGGFCIDLLTRLFCRGGHREQCDSRTVHHGGPQGPVLSDGQGTLHRTPYPATSHAHGLPTLRREEHQRKLYAAGVCHSVESRGSKLVIHRCIMDS